jgi:hypothetical protein
MYPHRIRLRDPWLTDAPATPGRVCRRRRFGYPGRIDAYERVWLTIADTPAGTRVTLNGDFLGEVGGPCEFDVTARLRDRNEVVIAADDAWGEVALEVRCTAFLRAIRCTASADRVHATGEVVGTSPEMLELYLLLNGSTKAYVALPAPVSDQPFQMVADALPAGQSGPIAVRIDLVRAAVIWYSWERELTWETLRVRQG